MNIEGMSRDEPVFAEGSPRDSRRRARGIDMGDEYLRRSIFAYVDRNPLIVVFHFTDRGRLPKLSDKELREIRAKFLDVLKEYPDVTFYGTWVDDNGMGICCNNLNVKM